MTNINLYTTWFSPPSETRRKELWEALLNNLNCFQFSKITIVYDEEPPTEIPIDLLGRLAVLIKLPRRPKFCDLLDIMRCTTTTHEICVLSNSDIGFDASISYAENLAFDQAICLSRWDKIDKSIDSTDRSNYRVRNNPNQTQDSWIFKGPPSKKIKADYHFGVPGCDNKFALDLSVAGYYVYNPCVDIKSYHYHDSEERYYSSADRLAPPYLRVPVSSLPQTSLPQK